MSKLCTTWLYTYYTKGTTGHMGIKIFKKLGVGSFSFIAGFVSSMFAFFSLVWFMYFKKED